MCRISDPWRISEIREGLSRAGSGSEEASTQVRQEGPGAGPGLGLGNKQNPLLVSAWGAITWCKRSMTCRVSAHLRVCVVL